MGLFYVIMLFHCLVLIAPLVLVLTLQLQALTNQKGSQVLIPILSSNLSCSRSLCSSRYQPRQQPILLAYATFNPISGGGEQIQYPNSAAASHMTPNDGKHLSKSSYSGPVCVKVGDGTLLPITHVDHTIFSISFMFPVSIITYFPLNNYAVIVIVMQFLTLLLFVYRTKPRVESFCKHLHLVMRILSALLLPSLFQLMLL